MTARERQSLSLGYSNLSEILTDKSLARLGDSYVNFVYSLALSLRTGRLTALRVKSEILSEALKRSNLRGHLPKRTDRHRQADAVEALIVYSWLGGFLSLEESAEILLGTGEPIEGFTNLTKTVLKRIRVT